MTTTPEKGDFTMDSSSSNLSNHLVSPSLKNSVRMPQAIKSITEGVTSLSLEFDPVVFTTAFRKIYDAIQKAYSTGSHLKKRVQDWKDVYDDLTKRNTKKQYLFSLDSFFFQYKLFLFEMEHFAKYLALLNHRMYGDYYRLYMEIVGAQNQDIASLHPSIPKYKPMEPFLEYSLKDIGSIHSSCISLVTRLYDQFIQKQKEMVGYKNKRGGIGYSMFPFLNTLKYEISLIMEQCSMYQNHLLFFYEYHQSFLKILLLKMDVFESNLNTQFQLLMNDTGEEDSKEEDTTDAKLSL